jgi:hypothetical protein
MSRITTESFVDELLYAFSRCDDNEGFPVISNQIISVNDGDLPLDELTAPFTNPAFQTF